VWDTLQRGVRLDLVGSYGGVNFIQNHLLGHEFSKLWIDFTKTATAEILRQSTPD